MKQANGEALRHMLRAADRDGYAVPMFNYTDLWDLAAVLDAAEELRAPVMFASIPRTVEAHGVDVLGAIGTARMSRNPSAIHHLDHSGTVELCVAAIDSGYPSVMIDASKESLENNIRAVKAVVDYARPRGVFVEAELGRIKGRDYEGTYGGDDFLIKTEDAVALAEATGVDSLAVGIGTAHGFYEGKPEINFERLAQVNSAIGIPLVLHGGTGIPEEDVRKAIRNGINKVNVGTQIRYTYLKAAGEQIAKMGPGAHTTEIMRTVRQTVAQEAKKWIRACMAEGRA